MKKTITLILWITGIISLYVILSVGLDWFWKIGSFDNADEINQILINMSYSYFAGLFFYILVTLLPFVYKKEKFAPIINDKITTLHSQINACVQTFKDIDDLIKGITKEELSEILNLHGMYDNSFYANIAGFQSNNFQFLVGTKEKIIEIIESTKTYGEYLHFEQILNIEKIRDSSFLHLVSTYQETPNAILNYSSKIFKDELIDELYSVILSLRKIEEYK